MFSAPRLTVYTDRENVLLCLLVLLRRIKGMKTDVVVADPKPDTRIGKILRQLASVRICDHDLSDYTNINKENLFIEREHLLDRTTRHMMTRARFDRLEKLPLTCREAGVMQAMLSRYVVDMWGHLYAAQLLASFEAMAGANETAVLCLKATPKRKYFRSLMNGGVRLWFYPDVALWDKSLRAILKAVLLPFIARGEEGIPRQGRVGVQYVQGTAHKGYGTDFDFLPHSGVKGDDVVCMLDGDDALNPDDRAFLSSRRIDVMDVPRFRLSGIVKHHARAVWDSLWPALRGVRGSLAERVFLYGTLASYAVITSKFLTIFERTGVSVFVNVADTNVDAIPKILALEHLGGVDLSFEFSATGYHAYMDCRPLGRHQYLAWGAVTESMIRDCQAKLPYPILPKRVIHSGNLRFHLPMTDGQKREIAEIMVRPGRKILILDSLDTHLKLLSRRRRQAFYDAVLKLIAARSDDQFIIKPQGDMHLRDDQQALLASLVAAGRVVLVKEPGLMHPFLNVVDLVIGAPIYASAVFEALSARKTAICFDNADWLHVMSERLPSALLARTAAELVEKTDHILSGRLPPETLWDIAALSREIDPYGDTDGVTRFGQYIGAWARAIDRHGNADAALPVIDKYIDWLQPSAEERKAS